MVNLSVVLIKDNTYTHYTSINHREFENIGKDYHISEH